MDALADDVYCGAFRSAGTEWTQTGRGPFVGSLQSIRVGSARVFRDRFSTGWQRSGRLKSGHLLVGTIADAATRARWFGVQATDGDVAVASGKLDASAVGAGELYSVLLDARTVSGGVPCVAAVDRVHDDAYLCRNPLAAGRLRTFLGTLFELGDRVPGLIKAPALQRRIQGALMSLLRGSGEGRRIVPNASLGGRFAAVQSCVAYMRAHIDEAISLRELCDLSGLRSRSLINAFDALTGVSPMAYLKAQRLNGVRRALMSTSADRGRIIDIALDWGFGHMGHFVADYRAMFGERPSQTPRAAQSRREPGRRAFSRDERTPYRPHSTGGSNDPSTTFHYAALLAMVEAFGN
ncbi:MAG TPA: helix-turn-helix domain-containing protein [Verrucomicrobiae bacterium]|nr:helix-turn-helix domain-containing protein [Verrucomicrobiae bacterium]